MTDWLLCALRSDIVWRAAKTRLVVGTILMLINHGDTSLAGAIGSGRLFRIALTYLVPYAVSTTSGVGTVRAMSSAS